METGTPSLDKALDADFERVWQGKRSLLSLFLSPLSVSLPLSHTFFPPSNSLL